jgi:DNA-binding MarR family transcriptional regulator
MSMVKNTNNLNVSLLSDYSIWGLYADTMEHIARARTMELTRFGITREQSHVLRILYETGGPLTLNEIASRVLRKHNSVSTIIKRMAKNHLVDMTRVPNDKQYQISITDKGRNLFEKMPTNSITMAFSALSAEEKKVLVLSLQKLENKVRRMLGLDYQPPFLK